MSLNIPPNKNTIRVRIIISKSPIINLRISSNLLTRRARKYGLAYRGSQFKTIKLHNQWDLESNWKIHPSRVFFYCAMPFIFGNCWMDLDWACVDPPHVAGTAVCHRSLVSVLSKLDLPRCRQRNTSYLRYILVIISLRRYSRHDVFKAFMCFDFSRFVQRR